MCVLLKLAEPQTEIGDHFDETCKDMNASTTVVDLLYTVCALNKTCARFHFVGVYDISNV